MLKTYVFFQSKYFYSDVDSVTYHISISPVIFIYVSVLLANKLSTGIFFYHYKNLSEATHLFVRTVPCDIYSKTKYSYKKVCASPKKCAY